MNKLNSTLSSLHQLVELSLPLSNSTLESLSLIPQEHLLVSALWPDISLAVKLPLKNLPTQMITSTLSLETVMLDLLTSFLELKDGDKVPLILLPSKELQEQSTPFLRLTEKQSNSFTASASMPIFPTSQSMPERLLQPLLSVKSAPHLMTLFATSIHQELSLRLEMLLSDPLKLETELKPSCSLLTF